MRKIVLIALALLGVSFAQPPGELLPVFPAPLDDVLLPWPDLERVDDALCWPDDPAPFIGAAYTWACYYSPLPRGHVFRGLLAGFQDAGYVIGSLPGGPGSVTFSSEYFGGHKVEYHVLNHAENGTLFTIAAEF